MEVSSHTHGMERQEHYAFALTLMCQREIGEAHRLVKDYFQKKCPNSCVALRGNRLLSPLLGSLLCKVECTGSLGEHYSCSPRFLSLHAGSLSPEYKSPASPSNPQPTYRDGGFLLYRLPGLSIKAFVN